MFESFPGPHLFSVPLGVSFGRAVIAGLEERMAGAPPETLASVEIIVNTRRLQRQLRDILAEGPPRLHPKIRVLTDLALDPIAGLDMPVAPLKRRLELMRLTKGLIAAEPDLAPEAAAFDLADSLARLFEEMHGEGVDPQGLGEIEVPDSSGHWQRALRFVDLVASYFAQSDAAPDNEGRLRAVALALADTWAERPPDHPVIVAGSTGSRGATSLFMEMVARLPNGAVILPGFDTDLPQNVWQAMEDPALSEDHPQYRFRRLADRLDVPVSHIQLWTESLTPPAEERNRLVSLSLRPAPVTDQWLDEAPRLAGVAQACAGMTLVAAESRREEADVIALRLRLAVEEGQTAALITPDRLLTRQVAAALDPWGIIPDDSAGTPLSLSPPGRLLLSLLDGMVGELRADTLLTVLKHPLIATGHGGQHRGRHLLNTRELELYLRSEGIPFPGAEHLTAWAEKRPKERQEWVDWLLGLLPGWSSETGQVEVKQRLYHHVEMAERLCAGPKGEDSGELWNEAAGRAAKALIDDLLMHSDAAGPTDHRDYATLIARLLSAGEVRDRDRGDPRVLFLGTLEARVQSADVVILGSMNDGTWPEIPPADPWLNRQMRRQAGLLLPERRVGLSAHDYQQAMASPEVWITRAVRSDDAQTVPSRWVNRLTNLLEGLEDDAPLKGMVDRGQAWLEAARRVAAPKEKVDRATRPSPCPPIEARPRRYSVTQIEGLTRDPYEIYAKKVLKLSPLHPLQREPDALARGILVHDVLERFGRVGVDPASPEAADTLMRIAGEVLEQTCPWPTIRALWLGWIGRAAGWLVKTEVTRQQRGVPTHFEATAKIELGDPTVLLTGRADRIDIAPEGGVWLYDYKTGDPPTEPQQWVFNPQLLLLAAMAERGAFAALGSVRALGGAYIGVGSKLTEIAAPLEEHPTGEVWERVSELLIAWNDPERGYTARIANKTDNEDRDFDHLSRLHEWDVTDDPVPVILT